MERPTKPSRSPKAGSPRMANISAGRSMSRNSPTARSWCRTILPARYIVSRMRADNALLIASPRLEGRGLIALVLAMIASAPALAAGNITAGRQKALQCQTCHGLDGLSKIPDAPNIAGNPEGYL